MINVRASMPSISVWSIIVALDITRGLDTDLHDVARKVSPTTCPNQLELFWIKHLRVHIYMLFMHFIYTMDAFGLTV
jgi:hypothetical protein